MTHDLDDINFGVQVFFTEIMARFCKEMTHSDLMALTACRDDVQAEMARVFGNAGQGGDAAGATHQLVKG